MSTVEREWRNRQTRTFEGRVGRLVRVQVPSLAPRISNTHLGIAYFYCFFAEETTSKRPRQGDRGRFIVRCVLVIGYP